MADGKSLLRLEGVHAGYRHARVLHDVSLEVQEGAFVAVVGANGAGKSTLLKTIVGLLAPAAGTLMFKGEDVGSLPAHQRTERGMVLVPEGRQVFPAMTVLENLELGAHAPRARARRGQTLGRVFELFPHIEHRRFQAAGTLSGGEQQMLAIGRGLMSLPRLLMLDEPSLGLAPVIVDRLFDAIRDIRRQGVTILLVEQSVQAALDAADFAYVLEQGRVVLAGPARDLASNARVKTAYLGL